MESKKRKGVEVVDQWEGLNEVLKEEPKKRRDIRISYTNIDVFLSKRLECMDHLGKDKPDIMCIVETKLRPNLQLDWFGDGSYRVWRKDRMDKSGGGIIVLTRKDLTVKKVSLSEDGEEVVGVEVTDGRQHINFVTVYVPPKTSAWPTDQYKNMIKNTIERLRMEVARRDKVVIVGDFNCKEIMWEEFEVGSGGEWGEQLMDFALDNMLTQWVRHPTRGRQRDALSRLDLIFTKGIQLRQEVEHECPLGRSDHELLKFLLDKNFGVESEEEYKEERLNYNRARYNDMRSYFENIDWSELYQEENIQAKYNKFMDIYTKAMENFVPKYTKKTLKKNQWFDRNCVNAKKEKEKAWKRYKRKNEDMEREAYKTAKNRYVEVRRTTQKEYEQKIVEHCESDTKMFYKFINSKLQKKEMVEKVKVGENVYEDAFDIVAKLNDSFCKVFTSEKEFKGNILHEGKHMQDIEVSKRDIEKIIGDIDVNKSMGPDGVSGKVLNECQKQLLDPILDIVKTSITNN